ncbi:PREDICTED: formin-like protein 2 [Brassica oleracea var. oleracea]|uniref:formin-like protein 2 n=1 Tax=Brassica oleracea var. oleracea TaxID=109376 RepID=UPI0006A6DB56|nr:PREDICTED: formin-like protein 2 [Brassica oleracea var. oleracea]
MSRIPFVLRFATILFLFSSSSSADQRLHSRHSRHLLHQPFFPITTAAPPPYQPPPPSSEPPSPSPRSHHHHKNHPETISSLVFPTHNKPHNTHHTAKLLAIAIAVVSAAILLSLLAVVTIFIRRRASPAKSAKTDARHLFNAAPSDVPLKHKHPPKYTSSNTSSEFLYLGTLVNSGLVDQQKSPSVAGVLDLPPAQGSSSSTPSSSSYSQYQKLGSPELRPLPPLPKLPVYTPNYRSTELLNPKGQDFDGDDNENDEFYSPRGSPGRKQSPPRVKNSGSVSSSLKPPKSSLSPSLSLNSSNGSVSKKPVPTRPPPPPPPQQIHVLPATNSDSEKKEETLKPKLKPLHWDKVRASSSRVTVWDQIKSNSFQVNEEMIETLFRANDPTSRTKESVTTDVVHSKSQFLDPRKSHNIAILLRALNVTADEVCEALVEGNSDALGSELLQCLLKMAPTKEEEDKLKELKEDDDDETSPSKTGPAERFLRALLNIPLAFKRINAMLYIVNFESETEYLKRSFHTLEAACGELKNTRMFLKLLEAVLKTGNRMNIGTNRGDAHAFKLDTLLKLVDIKGADGKTTLLHFVVQEIIKSEGARVSTTPTQRPMGDNIAAFQDDLELKKLGLQVVSGLSSQLTNVKKAAAMDSTSLSDEAAELSRGITSVKEVIMELKQETGVERFLDSMNSFLSKAEKEITEMQSHGDNVLKMVKEVTEYFHGNSESHPSRIFTVVRDFLTVLDQVCKEVGRVNERTVYGSSVPRASTSNQVVTPLFPVANNDNNSEKSHSGSLDKEEDDDLF